MAEVLWELESLSLIPSKSCGPSNFSIGEMPTAHPTVAVWVEVFTSVKKKQKKKLFIIFRIKLHSFTVWIFFII